VRYADHCVTLNYSMDVEHGFLKTQFNVELYDEKTEKKLNWK